MASVIRIQVEGQATAPLEFNLADFAGQLPQIADVIVPPDAGSQGALVWEVVYRAFDPGQAFDAGSCLRCLYGREPVTSEDRALFI